MTDTVDDKCKKCKGSGYIKQHIRVEGGRCYRCGGTGLEASYLKRKADEAYNNSPEGKAAYQEYLKEIRKGHSLY